MSAQPQMKFLPRVSVVPRAAVDLARNPALSLPGLDGLILLLLRQGDLTSDQVLHALALQEQTDARLCDILLSHQMVGEGPLYDAVARHWGVVRIDPARDLPQTRLLDRLGAQTALRDGLLPLRSSRGAVIVLTSRPEEFARHRPHLMRLFGNVVMAVAAPRQIDGAILALRGSALARAAQTRVPEAESCRNWGRNGAPLALIFGLLCLGALFALAPAAGLWILLAWAGGTLALATLLRLAALMTHLRPRTKAQAAAPEPAAPQRLPVISILVPLFRERDIAARLIGRLDRLDYPRELLDVLLLVEELDHATRDALDAVQLPGWMRVVLVPDAPLKTKPRALNFGLDMCRGSIVGVYDAEDAPEPSQLRKIAARFHDCAPQVACLQGILDFYNPRTNWLSRCFTIEYAAWFRVILPGLQRLGLPIPLGGTTLFFRRRALEDLGGWDAHNVTEDADLGIRIARHGYRTELIDTVTREEANCHPVAWIRQRSRWLKGYMMTWAVHMRAPGLLWRQLGPWKFAGFQVLFLCTLSQFLLAPLLWSFWLMPVGVTQPLGIAVPHAAILALLTLYFTTELVNLLVNILGLRRTTHRLCLLWIPTLQVYFPLGAIASYKAMWEMMAKPFYWDKTTHGIHDVEAQATTDAQPPRTRSSPASTRSRVSKALEMCSRSAP